MSNYLPLQRLTFPDLLDVECRVQLAAELVSRRPVQPAHGELEHQVGTIPLARTASLEEKERINMEYDGVTHM